MKIAHLTEKYPPDVGGLAVSSQRLVRALAGAGLAVQVMTPDLALAPGQAERRDEGGVTVHRLGAHRRTEDTLAGWFDYLAARHAETAFDLLHAYYMTQAGFVAAYAGRYLGVPSVVSARGNDLDRAVFEPGRAAHVLYALREAGAVTANSRDLVRKAQALAPGREVTLIPNGLDATLFAPAPPDPVLKHSLGLGDLPVMGFVGEARAKKGLATMLMAFREAVAQRPAALLLVGGVRSGEDKDTLKVFQKQNRDLAVVVVPQVPPESLPAYYNLIDILLLPSIRDGLPNALLEGMACERAVIASSVGGIPDAVREGENGWLVPPGDVSALAAAIVALLDDGALRARLGQAARISVMRDFNPQRELELNLAIYAKLLGGE